MVQKHLRVVQLHQALLVVACGDPDVHFDDLAFSIFHCSVLLQPKHNYSHLKFHTGHTNLKIGTEVRDSKAKPLVGRESIRMLLIHSIRNYGSWDQVILHFDFFNFEMLSILS